MEPTVNPDLPLLGARLERLVDLPKRYDVLFCDVWGVVHNGVAAYPVACEALSRARHAGRTVILITNSPRRRQGVARQLAMLGVPDEAYDGIVTSGDVTRALIEEGPEAIYFLGPARDHELLDGLAVRPVAAEAAEAVVCTGLFDDENETPADYDALLAAFKARDLPFICANPDLVVERGERMIYCAGALAARYRQIGGQTRISGKPHRPIYEAALAMARDLRGTAIGAILAIGDGAATDLLGGQRFGLDTLFVTDGIHAQDYADGRRPDPAKLGAFLAHNRVSPRFWMPKLA